MPRPVKWSRDLHAIRERAERSRTETWSRSDLEHLFTISRPSAQSLIKAIGGVTVVGGTHFVERAALLKFLEEMSRANSVEEALRTRLGAAEPPPRPKPLRVTLPADLRNAMLPDLPANITLEPGRLEIRAETAVALLESLVTLAAVMGNDLDRFQQAVEPPRASVADADLQALLSGMRDKASASH